MLIPIQPRHRCPSCGVPQIADCYFAALRVPIVGSKRSRHHCPSCNTHIWYQAKRSIPLLLVRLVAVALLLAWALSIPGVVSVDFGLYFVVCVLLGVSLMLIDMLRGTVMTKPSNTLFRN
ncbi:hypothetical protein CA13_00600 [Planctomycetes bacterium CA13]|uniref:Cxxc_20_cxxc protein n=1 Tax=Novipirellula herctigrandis TaxID=2527986 RepID=A0A5C5YUJ3_9BACT|nr:hypothetical protein CA13_00600 [Planctomycetes bacterium CA13]